MRVGYGDSSHFIRDFKARTGYSPRQYRLGLPRRLRTDLAEQPSHPFYGRLNQLLQAAHFDALLENECKEVFARNSGLPLVVPSTYFRLLLVGYFEGIDSERGIAWRAADSLGVRQFLSIASYERAPNHHAISQTRTLLGAETHCRVFVWVMGLLAQRGFLKKNAPRVHDRSHEANIAWRPIVRRDGGESYKDFLAKLFRVPNLKTLLVVE